MKRSAGNPLRGVATVCLVMGGIGLIGRVAAGDTLEPLPPAQTPAAQSAAPDTSMSDPAAVAELISQIAEGEEALAQGNIHRATVILQSFQGLRQVPGVPAMVRLRVNRLGLGVEKLKEEAVMKRFAEVSGRIEGLLAASKIFQAHEGMGRLLTEFQLGPAQAEATALSQKIEAAVFDYTQSVTERAEKFAEEGKSEEIRALQVELERLPGSSRTHNAHQRLEALFRETRLRREREGAEEILVEGRAMAEQGRLAEAQAHVQAGLAKLSLAGGFALETSRMAQNAFDQFLQNRRPELEAALVERAAQRTNELLASIQEMCAKSSSYVEVDAALLSANALLNELRTYRAPESLQERVQRAITEVQVLSGIFESLEKGYSDVALQKLEVLRRQASSPFLPAEIVARLETKARTQGKNRLLAIVPADRHGLRSSLEMLNTLSNRDLEHAGWHQPRSAIESAFQQLLDASDQIEAGQADLGIALQSTRFIEPLEPLRREVAKEAALLKIRQLTGEVAPPEGASPGWLFPVVLKQATEGKIEAVQQIENLASLVISPPQNTAAIRRLAAAVVALHSAREFEASGDAAMAIMHYRKVVASPVFDQLDRAEVKTRLGELIKAHPELADSASESILEAIQALRDDVRRLSEMISTRSAEESSPPRRETGK